MKMDIAVPWTEDAAWFRSSGAGTCRAVSRAVTSQPLVLGILYILFVLFLPAGVVGGAAQVRRRLTREPA